MGNRFGYATEADMAANEELKRKIRGEQERFWSERQRDAVAQGAARGLGELVGAPLGLSSAKAMGASVVGPELPADRMTALVDIVRAKTPAGKLSAIEAGIRAGYVTLAEALEWMGGE